jgi:uncharacterized lipoprotein YbaY
MLAHPCGKTSQRLCGIQTISVFLDLPMSSRPLFFVVLAALLAACSSEAPKPSSSAAAAPTAAVSSKTISAPVPLGPLPVYQRELTGLLLGVPNGAEVELAVLVIDQQDRPQKLLTSAKITGDGKNLPLQLRFNPDAFPQGARVELRGRVSQSGQLSLHLSPVRIEQPTTQNLGQLQFVPAP